MPFMHSGKFRINFQYLYIRYNLKKNIPIISYTVMEEKLSNVCHDRSLCQDANQVSSEY